MPCAGLQPHRTSILSAETGPDGPPEHEKLTGTSVTKRRKSEIGMREGKMMVFIRMGKD